MTEEYKGEAHYWTDDADGDPVLPKPGKVVQKWADSAMFTAEPINADEGPKVYLLWMTPDPLAAIAAPSKMYKGEVARSLRDVTHAEREEYVEQLKATKLKAPYEFVKFHFLIEGVTRAFTHQMVRQRTAVYAQESLRFAVKEDMPVGLPPSLAGTTTAYRDVVKEWASYTDPEREYYRDWDDPTPGEIASTQKKEEALGRLSKEDRWRFRWDRTVEEMKGAYLELVDAGMPAEDARGLLPHNTLTRLHYSTDLRALLDHAGNRLCTQAQFEWRLVFSLIARAIREYNPYAGLRAMADNMDDHLAREFVDWCTTADRWQYEAIAALFRPVCYQTGKCEFKANFDRKCAIRERVDARHTMGHHSDQWGRAYHSGEVHIDPINPAEWLLDPGAAR